MKTTYCFRRLVSKNILICLALAMSFYGNTQNSYKEWTHLGFKKNEEGKYKESISAFNNAIKLDSGNSEAYFGRGISYKMQKEYQKAISDLDRAIALNFPESFIYTDRGTCKSLINDVNGALEDFNTSLSLAPNDYSCLSKRGKLKAETGDAAGGMIDIDAALKLRPNYVEAMVNKGVILYEGEEFKEAMEWFNKASEFDKTNDIIYFHKGLIKGQYYNDPDGALDDLNTCIALNPSFAEAFRNRGTIKLDNHDLSGALKDYTEAIRLNPEFYLAYSDRGYVYINLENYQSAYQDFDKSIQLNKSYANGYQNRGMLKFYLNQNGCEDLNKALSLGHPKAKAAINELCK